MAKRIDTSSSKRELQGSKFSRSNSAVNKSKKSKNKIIRFLFKLILILWGTSMGALLLGKFLPIYFTPTMMSRKLDAWSEGKSGKIYSNWASYEEIDRNCALAVIASEDQLFPDHNGFDFDAMIGAAKNNMKGKRIKGASTISQQVAKNVFLWQGRSYIRKGLEAYFTFMIELIWGKKRILEVYLNVAETGKMTFGVEAACRKYYDHTSTEVSKSEAARIAAVLPNPIRFSIENPSGYVLRRTSQIQRQMRMLGGKKFLEENNL
ncbi:monofunctional biosynthetic peptidoglycan transglycosylase [Sandaracinomonas limnophila]|uniref:Biosynthetic peptidoglycan transglycosylase n=1 Tax=Sandaracinomonas limnophila TaxID=1862386 RepID=A0A437PW94_9BACT|nr:monofunctional biosynthetic peptidoglycan transglycosylase [Sandaracinomonas limnophila]RVU26478.1 monofunctional biosynthetic peptidoglycan transglycosylase [Sandaracinomonas limnophila]